VRLIVEPGQRARISRVTIEAEGELDSGATPRRCPRLATLDQVRKAWPLPAGSEFRNADWGDAKDAVLARLRAAGYANAVFSGTAAEVDVPKQEVRIFVAVDSGPLFRFGKLRIEGLATHDENTVGYLVGARRGAPVTENLLLDFQDRLQKSGLFDGISVTLDTDPQHASEAAVVAKLQESPLQVYTFGLGFSANTRERASVEHLYRRVFGYAAQSRLKIELGRLRQAWDGEISSHPGEGLYRNLIGGAVERLLSDTDEVLSQRVRIGRAQDTTRLERLFFVELERSLRRTDAGDRNSAIAGSLQLPRRLARPGQHRAAQRRADAVHPARRRPFARHRRRQRHLRPRLRPAHRLPPAGPHLVRPGAGRTGPRLPGLQHGGARIAQVARRR
jgi:translocation and assembly module TamA